MKIISVMLIAIFISGCSLFDKKDPITQPPERVEKPVIHPAPIRPLNLNDAMEWETLTPDTHDDIIVDEKYAFQCLSWNDYLILGQNMQTILAKFDEYEGVLCYYRKDLKEPKCVRFKIPAKKVEKKDGK